MPANPKKTRAGAGILPYPDSAGHDLQAETFKYYWALAHRDPTSGVQVRFQFAFHNTIAGYYRELMTGSFF